MQVKCESCGAKLNIPDGKIPQGRRVVIRCPKCKNKLSVESPVEKYSGVIPDPYKEPAPEDRKKAEDYSYGSDDETLDVYEEGVKLALVMENEAQQIEKLTRSLEELGYRYVSAQNTREAIGKMRLHQFSLAILSDRFDDMELRQSPVLHHLNHLPMSIRRHVFVVLIGDSFKTMDPMMAFAMSANAVVNRGDLDKMTGILRHAIADNEKFYKVFMDTLKELGKA